MPLIPEIRVLQATQIQVLLPAHAQPILQDGAKPVILHAAEQVHQLLAVTANVPTHNVARDARAVEAVRLGAIDGVEEPSVAHGRRKALLLEIAVDVKEVLVESLVQVAAAGRELLEESEFVLRRGLLLTCHLGWWVLGVA